MWKDAVRVLETGQLGQVGLVAFVVAFVLVLVYVATLSKRHVADAARLPLDDELPPVPDLADTDLGLPSGDRPGGDHSDGDRPDGGFPSGHRPSGGFPSGDGAASPAPHLRA